MAGHSQFKNIMYRKGAQDKKRAKLFAKLAKEITVAAKQGLPDPEYNPRLRAAIQAARAENMPKDNIERAIKKSSDQGGENYEEVRYEGFGPGGIGVIVETLTDNRNRTASVVRSIFTKNGGNLGETGSVSFMFSRLGRIEYAPEAGSAEAMLDAAIEAYPASLTLDYLDLYGLKPSVEKVLASGVACRVASPRMLKPGEEKIADFLLRLGCPILVRPAGLLHSLRGREGVELTGDFSLNAANAVSVRMLLDSGLARLTPTHDLNAAQVATLARQIGGSRIEAVAYHHLPVFHTEHCLFCRFLSTGTTFEDCGRPCEKHRVELRDSNGRAHPVLADAGCRNTVFGAEAQEASLHLKTWLDAGIVHFRLEFAHESPAQITAIASAFAAAFRRPDRLPRTWRGAEADCPAGRHARQSVCVAGYLELPILQ